MKTSVLSLLCFVNFYLVSTTFAVGLDPHLKVTYGMNPFNSNYFASLPMTVDEAISKGN